MNPFFIIIGATLAGIFFKLSQGKKKSDFQGYTPKPSGRDEIWYTPENPTKTHRPPPSHPFDKSEDEEVSSPDGMG